MLAILRRHYGESVDLAPPADEILALARGSLAGLSEREIKSLTRKLAGRL